MPETIAPFTAHGSVSELAGKRAAAVDAGDADPRRTLEELTGQGLLTLGVPGYGGNVADQAAVFEHLAQGCLATAFCAWGHRMVLEYLALSGSPHLPALGRLDRIGSSAMAGAYKALAGIEPLAVTARREGDGLVLNGRLPWASNLHADTIVVLAVQIDGEGPSIAALPVSTEGVSVRPIRDLLALEATASGQILFEDARIDADDVVREPFTDLLERSRRPFLLLQTAYCLGLAGAALTAAGGHLTGLGAEFSTDADALSARRGDAAQRARAFADDSATSAHDLVQLRLDAAVLAREAVRIEAAVTGGRGFMASSPTGRRLREAAFLPVQSPTEGQLRWQLRQSA